MGLALDQVAVGYADRKADYFVEKHRLHKCKILGRGMVCTHPIDMSRPGS